ncbi:AAA family ATPase [Amycolatopsis sp. NPDC005232]|uniref:AAA family ATPase n=1 Tax=Amycolatopsis sp. NPDC005232 TaxID=3157027 RepID=UPI0033AA3542
MAHALTLTTKPPAEVIRPGQISTFVGRHTDSSRLDELLHAAVTGQSAGVVVRGPRGIGKTALLDHAAKLATGRRVIQIKSAAAETDLAYSTLQQLCSALPHELTRLEAQHRRVLEAAIGLRGTPDTDLLLVCVAVVQLLTRAVEAQPLVCFIDNAQWADTASTYALAFAVRRLAPAPVAMVIASRASCFAELPELVLSGLEHADARSLLTSALPGPVDERVLNRMVTEARGNPQLLLESARSGSPRELAGGYGVPVPARLRDVDAGANLSADGKLLLLLAAAEPLGDSMRLWRAAARLGIEQDTADELESAGLLSFGTFITFPDPALRGSVYGAAPAAERRRIHGVLAAATDSATEPDRHVWHLAQALVGPDDAIACELERAASSASLRGGLAAEAAFLERSALSTADPVLRASRAVAAAGLNYEAGAVDAAARLLATTEIGRLQTADRARVAHLRATMDFDSSRSHSAVTRLVASATAVEEFDPQLARPVYLEALSAAIFTGHVDVMQAVLPQLAKQIPKGSDRLLEGVVERCKSGYAAAVEPLKLALKTLGCDHEDEARARVLACMIAADLWDDDTWHHLTKAELARSRRAGARTLLPYVLTHRALLEIHTGQFEVAQSLVDESRAITDAAGRPAFPHAAGVLAAWQGRLAPELAEAACRGDGSVRSLARYAQGVLGNGTGNYADAARATGGAFEDDRLELQGWSIVEFIEAAARSGDLTAAADALERLSDQACLTGTDWALGVEARSRALLRDGQEAEDLYLEAIERLSRSRITTHLARAQLLYGEWLRRRGRRIDAREKLKAAQRAFLGMGADGFAGRASRELLATGERARRRVPETSSQLTPQEARIAWLARDGRSNPEIAAALSISPRTVEYHLHKVFNKLSITSRTQLHLVLAAAET